MIGFEYLRYLTENGHFKDGNVSVLDIGSQNLLFATVDDVLWFASRFGGGDAEKHREDAARIAYFSTPRPGERTTYVSELFDLTRIEYTSFDIAPALKTEIFDLNTELLPHSHVGCFDLIFNFGTTEHVLNQLNCYTLIHEALKVGGLLYEQPPSVGWLNHGYFAYHPKFYTDLARANGYKIVDMFYTPAGREDILDPKIPLRQYETLNRMEDASAAGTELKGPYYNLNVLMEKRANEQFRIPLEIETSHAAIDHRIAERYQHTVSVLGHTPTRLLLDELWRRIPMIARRKLRGLRRSSGESRT